MNPICFFLEDDTFLTTPVALGVVVNSDVRVNAILVNAGRKTCHTNEIILIYIMQFIGVGALPPLACSVVIEEELTQCRAVLSQTFLLANIVEGFTQSGLAE